MRKYNKLKKRSLKRTTERPPTMHRAMQIRSIKEESIPKLSLSTIIKLKDNFY